jgi:CHAP domain
LRTGWAVAAVVAVIVVGAAALLTRNVAPSIPGGAESTQAQRFPPVDRAALSSRQLRVIDGLHAQFDAQSPGETYAEGSTEPWCADFVSWVMNQAGTPLENPNSGSWRIPGVYTMQQYYQSVGRFEPPGFQPRPGDVVLWGEHSPMGLHANVVVAVDGTTLTTVGGNEGGIRVRTTYVGPDTGLLGYGRLA